MATTPKTGVGTMDCMCCGREIPVKAATNGTLNAACAWCDFPAYAKAGTGAHRIITGKLRNQPEQPPMKKTPVAQAAAQVAAEPAAHAPKPRVNSIFGF